MTNQNWNVNNGSFHQSQIGGGVVCQGAMMTITPFTTFNSNFRKPYRDYYTTPVYDPTDADNDGVPDNPGNILYYQENYSGNKDSLGLNFGIALTFNIVRNGV